MKKKKIRDIYFDGADDRNIMSFTESFLANGIFWIYIAVKTEKNWKPVYEKLPNNKKPIFRKEYNKAFLFCGAYKELARLFIGKELRLKNLFLSRKAETWPEKFVKSDKTDELRWKEALELAA